VCQHPFDSFRRRVRHARQCGDLYFASLISKLTIESVFGEATSILSAARIYNTSVTLWGFLSPVMSIHHGWVSAVAKLITNPVANGLRACSEKTGAYCIACDKLAESVMHRLLKASAESQC